MTRNKTMVVLALICGLLLALGPAIAGDEEVTRDQWMDNFRSHYPGFTQEEAEELYDYSRENRGLSPQELARIGKFHQRYPEFSLDEAADLIHFKGQHPQIEIEQLVDFWKKYPGFDQDDLQRLADWQRRYPQLGPDAVGSLVRWHDTHPSFGHQQMGTLTEFLQQTNDRLSRQELSAMIVVLTENPGWSAKELANAWQEMQEDPEGFRDEHDLGDEDPLAGVGEGDGRES